MNKQPKALYLLNFISMWECFSYYGMRVLLVLFMVHELRYGDEKAFGIYALYTTLVELGGVVGGMAADRFLGLKRSIALGGITIALGHICMALPDSQPAFFLGLGCIIAGTSLFRSNVAALLGEFYEENDPRRDAGYTLYYTGINLGGFLASIFCGVVGEVYGWHMGFGLAAIGMIAGNIALFAGKKLLEGRGETTRPPGKATLQGISALALIAPLSAGALLLYDRVTWLVPFAAAGMVFYLYLQMQKSCADGKQRFLRLALYLLFLILFFGCEEQLGSTLVLFAERHVARATPFGLFPAASLVTFNPLTILLIGLLCSRLLQKLPLAPMTKVGIGFALLGAAFCTLYVGCALLSEGDAIPLSVAIASIILISLGEILIGPTVYGIASELAPRSIQGLVMGAVTLGFSLSNLFSGVLSQTMTVTDPESSMDTYMSGFWVIGCSALVLSLLILMINQQRKVVTT